MFAARVSPLLGTAGGPAAAREPVGVAAV